MSWTHNHTAAISNEPHQSVVPHQNYERKLPNLPNKLLPSLLLTVDVHSGVSATTNRVACNVSAQIVNVRPEGISSAGSLANWVTLHETAGSRETIGGRLRLRTPVLPAPFHPAQRREAQVMAIAVEDDPSADVVDDCAMPSFSDTACYELQNVHYQA